MQTKQYIWKAIAGDIKEIDTTHADWGAIVEKTTDTAKWTLYRELWPLSKKHIRESIEK